MDQGLSSEVEQIVAKLTTQELDLLEDRFGFDLRNLKEVEVLGSLRDTRGLCQSPRGPYICLSCAQAAMDLLTKAE
jgi:hypothetical protein